MQINLSSDNYNIVSDGTVFLFEPDKDLTINISTEDFSVSLSIYFFTDISQEKGIKREITENKIVLKCYNFSDAGTGLAKPVEIAQIDGKRFYLMFWSYLEGTEERKARSVKYTIFYEK